MGGNRSCHYKNLKSNGAITRIHYVSHSKFLEHAIDPVLEIMTKKFAGQNSEPSEVQANKQSKYAKQLGSWGFSKAL